MIASVVTLESANGMRQSAEKIAVGGNRPDEGKPNCWDKLRLGELIAKFPKNQAARMALAGLNFKPKSGAPSQGQL